ncbi:MAG: tetratricopeptide repeat protein [Bacteroidales bacterium]|nr:tetratricopeptide repeat protein [Bacteroidales bacterium]
MANSEKIGTKQEVKGVVKENFITKIVHWYNQYEKIIFGVVIALFVIIGGSMALNRFYFQPRNQKGAAAVLAPIQYYGQAIQSNDTAKFNLALEGDEENDGFLAIISDYKMTKVANTAKYFAGLCYLNMGQKEEALDFFLKFKKKEDVYWYVCQMLIGDLYDEQGDDNKAIKYYEKAAKGDNNFSTPIVLFKLGQMYEKADRWDKAYATYARIQNEYYNEYQSSGIDKYLEKAKLKANIQ